ncbi:MAG: T9SS type A sorting domain-containing protein [Bacteroidota bacterium]
MRKGIPLLLSLFIPLFSFSQSNTLQYISSTTGAGCYEVLYHNGYLFAGAGNTLMVYQLNSNGSIGSKITEKRLVSNIDDLKAQGNKLYVAANHAGLSMWDLGGLSSGNLTLDDQYLPDSLNEAAYHIALKGSDSVFVAYKTKMALFKRNPNNTLSLLNKFAHQPLSLNPLVQLRIRGCAVKGGLLAFTTGYGAEPGTGVYLYNADNLSYISFRQQNFCDPEEVEFGQNNSLLYVAGGTESLESFGLIPHGIFYALNVSVPANPVEVYRDTVPGLPGIAISMPMNIDVQNDTVYVATQSGLKNNFNIITDTLSGRTYVYKAFANNTVQYITDFSGGLWHFDTEVFGSKAYVASEWYGIKTVNVLNVMSPVDMGNTLTGGWNLGADKFGSRLALANEGYGVKLFDITNLASPSLIATNTAIGFCWNINYSATGQHIFGWFYTGDDLRVMDPNTLSTLYSLNLDTSACEYRSMQVWQGKAIGIQIEQAGLSAIRRIIRVDVSNPLQPSLDTLMQYNDINDLFVNRNGKVFVARQDTIMVMDGAANMAILTKVAVPNGFTDFYALTEYNDTVFAFMSGALGGLRKYKYNGSNQLTLISTTAMNALMQPYSAHAVRMAADSFGLYISDINKGLYAFSKQNPAVQTGYYRHSMEFIHDVYWGVEDIICKEGLILLPEYFGQTSILSNDPNFTVGMETTVVAEAPSLLLYPNPASDAVHVVLNEDGYLSLSNALGQALRYFPVQSGELQLTVSGLPDGLYFLHFTGSSGRLSARLVISR